MKTKKIFYGSITCIIALLFVLPFCFTTSVAPHEVISRSASAPIFYGVMAVVALALLILYCVFFKQKYFWILLTIISVCICNVGHFALSLSSHVSEAILANKIVYFGNVFLPFFMLITIADACRFRYSKFSVIALFSISAVMFIFAATAGYLDLFYKTVEFEMVDGIVHLHKTYGVMHTVYFVYVAVYFIMMLGIIIYSYRKKKLVSRKHVITLLLIVFVNIALWLIERFVTIPFEILSFSYDVCAVLTIYLYKQLSKFGLLGYYNISLHAPGKEEEYEDFESTSIETEEEKCNVYDQDVAAINDEIPQDDNLASLSDDTLKEMFRKLKLDVPLTEREIEIAVLMIKNIKRKKIAEFLFVTEHTVKFHVTNIYKKLGVTNRNELTNFLKDSNVS